MGDGTVKQANAPTRRNKTQTKVDTALGLYEGGQKVMETGKRLWATYFEYSVVVSEKDQLYFEVHKWLIETFPGERYRSLAVTSSKSSHGDGPVDIGGVGTEEKIRPLIVRFNESTARTVKIGGYSIRVSLVVPDAKESKYMEQDPSKIIFVGKSYEAQQAVIKLLETINANRATSRKAVLKMVGRWGGWTTRSDIPSRSMNSVSLPSEQKDRIIADLKGFLEAEPQYNKLAIPWHRGYMFYGPPGTGKTSLVKALANEFNLDLWYVSLSDLTEEASLMQLLSEVGPRSLLLLEDIDTVKITQDRDGAAAGKISMGSLLNTLDGVATPHGLITMMTTNRFDVLDPALTRAGRMDLIEELSYPSLNTIGNLYEHFYEVSPKWGRMTNLDAPIKGLSTSQIAEIMKRHMFDPKAAQVAIIAEVRKYR